MMKRQMRTVIGNDDDDDDDGDGDGDDDAANGSCVHQKLES